MTCIVGLRQNDRIYLASDSQTTWGYTKHDSGSKIIKKGELSIAFCGQCSVAHTLEHRLVCPDVPENDEDKWLHVLLPDAMRKALQEVNLYKNDNNEIVSGADFIVGWRDHLATISTDFYVAPVLRDYVALGTGGEVAVGALYASEGRNAHKRLETAVNAAQLWSVGVGGDVYVEEVTNG